MNEELAERYRELVEETVGFEGRLISLSKSGYRERHPGQVSLFNANIAVRAGKVWHGDLDLSVDEPALVELARRLGQTVFVLHEADARFEREDRPLLQEAVYRVNQEGLCQSDHRFVERDRDGVLRERPPERSSRRRLVLTVGWPRLWRFWRCELVRREQQIRAGRERSSLLYLGERNTSWDGRRGSPLLVLGFFHTLGAEGWRGIEWTWYPSGKRHAPLPLLQVRLRWRRGRRHPYLSVRVHPGLAYTLYAGIDRDQQ